MHYGSISGIVLRVSHSREQLRTASLRVKQSGRYLGFRHKQLLPDKWEGQAHKTCSRARESDRDAFLPVQYTWSRWNEYINYCRYT